MLLLIFLCPNRSVADRAVSEAVQSLPTPLLCAGLCVKRHDVGVIRERDDMAVCGDAECGVQFECVVLRRFVFFDDVVPLSTSVELVRFPEQASRVPVESFDLGARAGFLFAAALGIFPALADVQHGGNQHVVVNDDLIRACCTRERL